MVEVESGRHNLNIVETLHGMSSCRFWYMANIYERRFHIVGALSLLRMELFRAIAMFIKILSRYVAGPIEGTKRGRDMGNRLCEFWRHRP